MKKRENLKVHGTHNENKHDDDNNDDSDKER